MREQPEQLVQEFFDGYSQSETYDRDLIARLTALALSEDQPVAESATRAIFASVVEKLADSFEPVSASLYNRIFAQIIQTCRRDSRALEFDRELNAFGLSTEQDLVDRAEALRSVAGFAMQVERNHSPRLVIVLSRVTLGADVAITSVIVERMKTEFPDSEIVLVGGRKTAELFGGDRRLQFRELHYQRSGMLIERLLTWIEVVKCVRQMTSDLTDGQYLVVDPDTRLTQLGLLPVTDPQGYLFFPSREYGSSTRRSLTELASDWLDEVFGVATEGLPVISLRRADQENARRLVSRLRGDASRRVIAMNFGVGENVLKRVGVGFETSLSKRLALEGAALILDKGASLEEAAIVDNILAEVVSEQSTRRVRSIESHDHDVVERLNKNHLDADIVVWNGGVGMLAGLIGESDLYIGYDSAGQHIAAALAVECIDVFAGYSSLRMVDRWRPTGRAETHLVVVDENSEDLVERCVRLAMPAKEQEDQ